MSRLGKLPIKLEPKVTATITAGAVTLRGPKGELAVKLHPTIEVKQEGEALLVSPRDRAAADAPALWGLMWSLLRNAAIGVSAGFVKKLEINGVGYRAAVAGDKLNLNLGFSHPVEFKLPKGVSASVAANII
jgi:large subunit ribosomal protein L6